MISYLVNIVICCLLATQVHGQHTNQSLQVSLELAAQEIAVYEALPVLVVIKNIGKHDLTIHSLPFVELDGASLNIRLPASSTLVLKQPQFRAAIPQLAKEPVRILKPDEQLRFEFKLSCDWQRGSEPIFVSKGVYKLWVDYNYRGIAARSNAVDLKVVEPSPSEAKALKIVLAMQSPARLYEVDTLFMEDLNYTDPNLIALAAIKESKIYANYARLILAWRGIRLASLALRMPEAGFDRDKELANAKKLLDQIDTSGFTLANDVQTARAQIEILSKVDPATISRD